MNQNRRFEEFEHWVNIGMVIKNRYGYEGFELFKYSSFKARNHNSEEELKVEYDTLNNNIACKKGSITILYYHAKEEDDDEKIFIEFVKTNHFFTGFDLSSDP